MARKVTVKGLRAFGSVDKTTTPFVYTPLSRITVEGLTLDLSSEYQLVEAADSDVAIESLPTKLSAMATFTLQAGDLKSLWESMGLAPEAFTDGLNGTTPTADELAILVNTVGQRQPSAWYFDAAGAADGFSGRRIIIHRGRLQLNGPIVMGRDQNTTIPVKIQALAPESLTDFEVISIVDSPV